MGIRTDLTSLGAIGLGTAVALVGTGVLLFANASHHVEHSACVDVPGVSMIAAIPAAPQAPGIVAKVSVDAAADAPIVVEVADMPPAVEATEAPKAHRVNVVISDRIEVRSGCVVEMRDRLGDVRVRALQHADAALARGDEARVRAEAVRSLADEIRAEAEVIRAEARASGEVDTDRIQSLVEAALEDAGIRRGGSWGN
jgi:hypothetical protein